MSISISGQYFKSEFEKALEDAVNAQFGNVSADITTLFTAASTFSADITSLYTAAATLSGDITLLFTAVATLSGNITSLSAATTTNATAIATLSGNITALMDFTTVSEDDTANFTLDLSTYHNFEIENANTAGKTLIIVGIPTAADTMLELALKLYFSVTAVITYTGTVTWSAATAPNPTAAGTFLINMKSFDAGTNWWASYTGLY